MPSRYGRTDRFEHTAGRKPIADVMQLVSGVRLLQFVEQRVVGCPPQAMITKSQVSSSDFQSLPILGASGFSTFSGKTGDHET